GIRDFHVTGVQTCALPILDGDGDGRVDLFNSLPDVFASVANYFVEKGGWERGGPVVVRANRAPDAADFEPEGLEPRYSLAQLARSEERRVGEEGWRRRQHE